MSVLYWFAEHRSDFGTFFFDKVTYLGTEAAGIIIICVLFWCINKKMAYRVGFTYFVSGYIAQGLKIVLRIARPWVLDPNFKPVESAIGGATGFSCPSGHTQAATALYGSLTVESKKWYLRLPLVLAIICVATSRLYLGVHTPLDVSLGFAISVVSIIVVYCLVGRIKFTKKNRAICAAAFCLVGIGIMVYDYILFSTGVIDYSNAADFFKVAGAGMGAAIGWYIESEYIDFKEGGIPVWQQIIKVAIGAGVALGLKSGLKVVFGTNFICDCIRYVITLLWIIAIYPMIFKKVLGKK